MTDDLPDRAIAATGGRQLWNRLCGLRIDISIGGPIWTMKGWPPEQTVDQILGADTANEHIVFTPFTRPDSQMVFDTAADAVTTQTLDAQQCKRCRPRGPGLGECCATVIGTQHIWGNFFGYACWNDFVTPFLFTYPSVAARQTEPGPLPPGSQTVSAPIEFINRASFARDPLVAGALCHEGQPGPSLSGRVAR